MNQSYLASHLTLSRWLLLETSSPFSVSHCFLSLLKTPGKPEFKDLKTLYSLLPRIYKTHAKMNNVVFFLVNPKTLLQEVCLSQGRHRQETACSLYQA